MNTEQLKMDFIHNANTQETKKQLNAYVHKRDVIDVVPPTLIGREDGLQKAWHIAFKTKTILLNKPQHEIREDEVDYATLDLLLATTKFSKADKTNGFSLIKAIWRTFWPYLVNMIKGYNELQQSWSDLVEDQDAVLKNYADQHLLLRIYKEFMGGRGEEEQAEFNSFKEIKEAEIEKALEEIRQANLPSGS
jgi:hypothetical protein